MFISNPVTPASIGAVPTSRQIIAGTQMLGGGDLSANRTLNSIVGDAQIAFPIAPAIQFGGAAVGIGYDVQVGSYVPIGDGVILYQIEITLNSKGSSVGAAKLVNMPFDCIASPRQNISAYFQNMTNVNTLFARGDPGSKTLTLLNIFGGSASLADDTNFNNNSTIQLTGFYFI